MPVDPQIGLLDMRGMRRLVNHFERKVRRIGRPAADATSKPATVPSL